MLINETPAAYQRKWDFDGEIPKKVKNENGRLAWPKKFLFLPITKYKVLEDDIPLFYKSSV